ncbi:phosphatase PAP2 family protein [Chitinophaga filiformis]|uniref:PAP2 superfamily protein n=1 Tax=Chitinophaga filiformis TaxID=104663 RepID=A0A1G8DDC8_CHIFI|nr:phosphatase PAP2 family protein [Chitinophaga filiformis]SDH55732.1 PAP2 superfamily protein [Chitinophaga filiformis]
MRLFLLLSLQLSTYICHAAPADTAVVGIDADTTKAANVVPTTTTSEKDQTPVPVFNTNLDYKRKIPNYSARLVSIVVPTAMMTYGAVSLGGGKLRSLDMSTRKEIMEDHGTFRTNVDDYLKWVPAAAVYALNMAGIHGKHNFADRTMLFGMSTLIATGSTFAIKSATNRLRPDGSTYNSFPSGHTAIAFMSAQFMWEEYHEVSPWYGVAGYAVAATTGALRIYNNRHWLSDVVTGAGLGILSTKAAYWLYPKMQRLFVHDPEHSSTKILLMPNYNTQWKSAGLSLMLTK